MLLQQMVVIYKLMVSTTTQDVSTEHLNLTGPDLTNLRFLSILIVQLCAYI